MYVSWQPTKPIWPFVWKIFLFTCLCVYFYFFIFIFLNLNVLILLFLSYLPIHMYIYLTYIDFYIHVWHIYFLNLYVLIFLLSLSYLFIYMYIYLTYIDFYIHVWHIYIIIFYSFQLFIFCFSESNFHPTILFLFNSHFLIFTLTLFMYPLYIYI